LSSVVYGDFNHDGYTDMAVGIPGYTVQSKNGPLANAGAVEIFYGGPNGISKTPSLLLTEDSANVTKKSAAGDEFGFALAVGDFSGNGYDDLAIGAPFSSVGIQPGAGNIFVFYGSAQGITTTGAQLFVQGHGGVPHKSAKANHAGFAMAAGDFNGAINPATGYRIDDLIWGSIDNTPNPPPTFKDIKGSGTVFELFGSPSGLTGQGAKSFDLTNDGLSSNKQLPFQHLGWSLAVGDFNGNGYDDLAIGIPYRNLASNQSVTQVGAVLVLYGGANGLDNQNLNQFFDLNSKGLKALDPEGGPRLPIISDSPWRPAILTAPPTRPPAYGSTIWPSAAPATPARWLTPAPCTSCTAPPPG
jgi:hypothetical protein